MESKITVTVDCGGETREATYRRPNMTELAAFSKMSRQDEVKAADYFHTSLCVDCHPDVASDAVLRVSAASAAIEALFSGVKAKLKN